MAIPEGYYELSRAHMSGAQYLNTDIPGVSIGHIIMWGQMTSTAGGQVLFHFIQPNLGFVGIPTQFNHHAVGILSNGNFGYANTTSSSATLNESDFIDTGIRCSTTDTYKIDFDLTATTLEIHAPDFDAFTLQVSVNTSNVIYLCDTILFRDGAESLGSACSMYFSKCQIYNTEGTMFREFIPIQNSSTLEVVLFDTVNSKTYNLTTGTNLEYYGLPINIDSFVELLISRCTLADGTKFSEEHKIQMKNYLYDKFSGNKKAALNINSGYNILKKISSELFNFNLRALSLPSGVNGKSVLTKATAGVLLDKYFSEYYNRFTTPTLEFSSSSTSVNQKYLLNKDMVYVESETCARVSIVGTVYGAGGGGSGAVTVDGDKNAKCTCTSGSGAAGTQTKVYATSKTVGSGTTYTLKGGSGGSSVTSGQVGGDPTVATDGRAGSDGEYETTSDSDFQFQGLERFHVSCGVGGGGGAGSSAAAGSVAGTSIYTGGSASGSNGGSATAAQNEWTGGEYVLSGGGGGGGALLESQRGSAGSSVQVGKNDSGTADNTYTNATAGGTAGGRGAYGVSSYSDSVSGTQTSQPTTIGAGGLAGMAKFITDEVAAANGGNGGNRGGFVLDTSCTAANKLFAISEHVDMSGLA